MKKYLYVFGIAALTAACSPKIAEIEDPSTVEAPVEANLPAEAIKGKQVYDKSCTTCHDFKAVDNYTKEQWAGILPSMISKAELDEVQAKQVSEYVNWELEH